MDSNPDEFVPNLKGDYPSKWRGILNSLEERVIEEDSYELPFLNKEEVTTLWAKLQRLQGDRFTQTVMDTLLQGELSSLSFNEQTKAPKRISLSASQVMLAQKMGVKPTDYAKITQALEAYEEKR